jgi:hypothetical protein
MLPKSLRILVLLLILILSSAGSGQAVPPIPQRIKQVAQLMGEDYNNAFGYSVALSSGTLAVGDPYDNQYGEEAGSVTVFQSDNSGNWTKITRLTPSDAEAGIRFGRAVALSGDRLVVGAPFDNDNGITSGSVYIFERDQDGPNAWGQVAKITASDAFTNDQFGWTVSVDGDTLVSGAYTKTYGGRVYIFERDAGGAGHWGETAQLNPDPPGFQACFGEALDLDDNLLAVGAYGGGDYSGYVYVFQRIQGTDQWQRLTRFRAADTYAYHYFGYAVSLDNWTILAGAPGVNGVAGAAYIFTADPSQPADWSEQAKLEASDGAYHDNFGIKLDLSADIALVGAPWHADATGSVYLYDRHLGGPDNWGESASILGDDSAPGDEIGYSASLEEQIAVVGAPGKVPTGSVYVFDLNHPWITLLPMVHR